MDYNLPNNRLIYFGQVFDESIEYQISNQLQVSINIVGIRYRTSTTLNARNRRRPPIFASDIRLISRLKAVQRRIIAVNRLFKDKVL